MEKTINEMLGYVEPDKEKRLSRQPSFFEEWYDMIDDANAGQRDDKTKHISFVCDGIMRKNKCDGEDIKTDQQWRESPKRVVFLIKDQNQDGCSWIEDTRKWLVEREDNWIASSKFMRNIANALWGLTKSTPTYMPSSSEIKSEYNKITKCFQETPFAFVECKKQGGISSISNKELAYYLKNHESDGLMYKDMLYKELDILDSNIFVCTNPLIYAFVKEYVVKHKCPGTELTPVISSKDETKNEASILLHIPSKTIILCSYHPSARFGYERFYNGVVAHYHAFLKSKPQLYREFFE